MALSYVNAAFTSGSTYTTTTMPVPSGIRAGDLLIMAITWGNGNVGDNSLVPAGWTLLANSGSFDGARQMVCAKVATGAESVVTIVGTVGDYWTGTIAAYRGGKLPPQVTGVWIDQSTGGGGQDPLILPAMTVRNPSPLIVYSYTYNPATFTAPAGYVIDSQGETNYFHSTGCWMHSTGLVSGTFAPTVSAGWYSGFWWGQAMVVGAGGGLAMLL